MLHFLSLMLVLVSQDAVQKKMEAAQHDFMLGHFDEAVVVAHDVLAFEPKHCEAHILIGQALLRSSRMEEAKQAFEQARQLKCRHKSLYEELSSIYDLTQQYEKAIDVYDDYLLINPSDNHMLNEKGLTLILLQKFDEAIQTLTKLETLQPKNIQTKIDLGCALLRAHRYGEAIEKLSIALKQYPKNTEALQYMAQAQAASGDASGAALTLDSLIQLSPKDTLVRAMRGRLRLLTQNPEGALSDYQFLVRQKPEDATALLGEAAAYIALGKLKEAQQKIQQARTILGEHILITVREIEIAWLKQEPQSEEKLISALSQINNSKEFWIELEQGATRLGFQQKSQFAKMKALQE